MTVEDKRKFLNVYCEERLCNDCLLFDTHNIHKPFGDMDDLEIIDFYNKIIKAEPNKNDRMIIETVGRRSFDLEFIKCEIKNNILIVTIPSGIKCHFPLCNIVVYHIKEEAR